MTCRVWLLGRMGGQASYGWGTREEADRYAALFNAADSTGKPMIVGRCPDYLDAGDSDFDLAAEIATLDRLNRKAMA